MAKRAPTKRVDRSHVTIYATASDSGSGFGVVLEQGGWPLVAFRDQSCPAKTAPYRALLVGLEETFLRGYKAVTVRSDTRVLVPNSGRKMTPKSEMGSVFAHLAEEVGEFSHCFERFGLERISSAENPARGILPERGLRGPERWATSCLAGGRRG